MRPLILSLLILASVATYGYDVPALSSPVIDEVGFISSQAAESIKQKLQQVYVNDQIQVQVFITTSLQGLTIEEAATKIFEKWQLGKDKTDQGVLFLIAPNQKKLRIEVGRGLEGDIPDVIAKRIIADTVAPYLKNQDNDMGVMQGVAGILHYAKASGGGAPPAQAVAGERAGMGRNMIGIIVFILWLLMFVFRGGGGRQRSSLLGAATGFALGRGLGGGGGFGGGGGGWGGGGGSSGGGGASGGW